MNELSWRRHAHLSKNQFRQARGRSTAIELPDDGGQGGPPDPEPTAFVTQQVPPSSGPAGASIAIHAVRNRPGASDDDDAGLFAGASNERDQGIVHHDDTGLETDTPHDPLHGLRIRRAIDSGYSQADRIRVDV